MYNDIDCFLKICENEIMTKRIIGFQFNEIKLNEGSEVHPTGVEQVQLLRVGEFDHTAYGKFSITKDTLLKLKENFENKVRRIDLAVDYFHESNKVAAGWISGVELREDDSELWINVDWTKNGKERIEEKELRYISADFDFNYTDSETKVNFGPTLLGAGLTNRPHVKDMQPILLEEGFTAEDIQKLKLLLNDNSKEIKLMDFEQMKEAIAGLSADQKAQVMEMLRGEVQGGDKEMDEHEMMEKEMMEKEMDEHEKKDKEMSEDMKKKLSEMEAENKKLREQIQLNEKESSFNVLLAEGKVVEAQRDAYVSGDFNKFVEQSVSINLSESGSGANNEEKMTAEKANLKLSEIAEKISEEKGISYSDALSFAIDENPELADIV